MPPYMREFRSTLQHRGETQVPKEVRESLQAEEGDVLVWLVDSVTTSEPQIIQVFRKRP
jgi:bifunctional DNA-binding transcriptional regulator/antitoxin component of YhaV-PrlF toxin-antitoxin module